MLEGLVAGVVGPGRVGRAVAEGLRRSGVSVGFVAGGSLLGAERVGVVELVRRSDLVVLSVPDDALLGVVGEVTLAGAWKKGQVVAHTSGMHGAGVLLGAKAAGARTVAVHPGQVFLGERGDVERMRGASFAVTGEGGDRAVGEEIVKRLGGEVVYIAEEDRGAYHAALSMGANFLVSLVSEARDLLMSIGVEEAEKVLLPLLRAALERSAVEGDEALTGPIRRGDVGTVEKHVEELSRRSPQSLGVYLALARRTVERVSLRGEVSAERAERMLEVLEEREREVVA